MKRKLSFASEAWEDYLYWQDTNRALTRRINELLKEACRTPYEGTGKPEPLKYEWTGWWSRRIDRANRMIYRATDEAIEIAALRHHY